MEIRKLHIDRPKSLSRMVAEEIKDAILKGVLRPGNKLVETELTRSLGVSRTPLREAFRELAAEGYITVIPHKGSYVSTISEEEVLAWLSTRVAKWWLPDAVVFVDELPHTGTGKLDKARLRATINQGRGDAAAAGE